jgi:hydrogenase-4 membrane subunit HyfE
LLLPGNPAGTSLLFCDTFLLNWFMTRYLRRFRVRLLSRTVLILLAIAQVVTLAIAFQRPAYAYADPGSGLLFLQVAGSMLAGALFIVRSKLRKLFHFGKPHSEEPAADQGQDIHQ